ncbi:Clostridium phage phiCTP1, Gp74, partial [uncultured Caudovirales phage]
AIRAGNDPEFEEAVQQKFQHAKSVLLKKHKDYGPKNIAQSPGGPLNGLRVRMWDKFARINHLIDSGATPENESLKDSFLDMANYAIIAMLVLDGEWPNE